ncbi:MAG: ATP-binding cassette domain-containing protein, partial [Pseudomonadota bacterium]|nr:ATP-binding cassette domain-containing protein [Pseudomonadota bacterium]
RIVVLRDGRNAGEFVTKNSSLGEVVEAMLGAKSTGLFEPQRVTMGERETMLDVRELGFGRHLQGISFNVSKGEIFGVFGLVGSGIEHLGRVIYGALGGKVVGDIHIDGKPYHPTSASAGKVAGIGFVAAERKKEGIFADLSLRENMVAAFTARYTSGPFVSRQMEEKETTRLIDALGIRTRGPGQIMRTLSGGNQQKVCVARWLAGETRLLILEEPTRGVDVGARRDLYRELRKLSESGLSVLMLSSDVEEVAGLSDRSIVIDRGTLVGRFRAGTPPEKLMAATATKQIH